MLFRQIVFYSLVIGLVGGLVLTAAQFWQVIPIIKAAEAYEVKSSLQAVGDLEVMKHSHSGDHEHDANAWSPQDGLERNAYTLLSNVLTAIGLGLVLLVAMEMSKKDHVKNNFNWKTGLLWAAAGYSVFFIAPSLGMPPEIPGSASAPLEIRQLWWLIAVLCTAAGLAGFAFISSQIRWGFLSLILIPQLLGAPQTVGENFANQPAAVAAELMSLSQQFVGATAMTNAAFWIALAMVAVWSTKRIKSISDNEH